jgi:hypothetical protein
MMVARLKGKHGMTQDMARKRWLVWALIAIIFSLWGCGKPKDDLSGLTESWIGADISQLIAKWGPPQQVLDLEDGNKIYTWSTTRSTTELPTHVPNTFGGVTTRQGQTVRATTTQSFCVDANGRIYR